MRRLPLRTPEPPLRALETPVAALMVAALVVAALVVVAGVAAGCGGASTEPSATARTAEVAELPEYRTIDPASHLLHDVRQVSAGSAHTCALRADGSVACWGDNSVGQLGDGTRDSSHVPVQVRALPPARWVAAGARSTCAATLDGEVYCWGANSVGQLGNGQQANGYTLPVRAEGIDHAWVAQSSDDAERNCAIIESGALSCWGQLASLGADGRPILASVRPARDREARDVVAVAIGTSHECVLTEGGEVRCRGYGPDGELGTRSTQVERSFVPVRGLDRVVAIAAGARHTCAARADGTAWCWGHNARGQLGNGGLASFHAPVRVDLPVAVRAIVAGDTHTCALGEMGNVYCWGDNTSAQLGDGTARAYSSVGVVRMRDRVLDLAAGARHTCAVVVGGGLQCWGDNMAGQLGDGTQGDRSWPVAVLGGSELDELGEEPAEAVAAR